MKTSTLIQTSLRTSAGVCVWLLTTLAAGCDRPPGGEAVATSNQPPVHIDSIFPIEEEIRRFRASLSDSATVLTGGADSRDELITLFVSALAARDRAALEALAISRAEFAYLYYPFTRFTRRPYEMSPALVWFQLENYGGKGLDRALEQYGGGSLRAASLVCSAAPENEGENTVWNGCLVRLMGDAGDTVTVSLFGGILERDGRVKFISYGNHL